MYTGLLPVGTIAGQVAYLFNEPGTYTVPVYGVRDITVRMLGNGGPGGFAPNQDHSGGGGGAGANAEYYGDSDPMFGEFAIVIPPPAQPSERPYVDRPTRLFFDDVEVAVAPSGGGGGYIADNFQTRVAPTGGNANGLLEFDGELPTQLAPTGPPGGGPPSGGPPSGGPPPGGEPPAPSQFPPSIFARPTGGTAEYDGAGGQGTHGADGEGISFDGGQSFGATGGAGIIVSELTNLINGGRVGGGGAGGTFRDNMPAAVFGGAALADAVPGTGGGGRGWSGGGQSFQSATAGATGFVLLIFPGDEPPPPPPSVILTDLYTATLRNLAGKRLMPAVSTQITRVDGVVPSSFEPVSRFGVQGDLVSVRTNNVFAPRSFVDVSDANAGADAAFDDVLHLYETCVHEAASTTPNDIVVHFRIKPSQKIVLTFASHVTPKAISSNYFDITPKFAATSFTISVIPFFDRPYIHRLEFEGTPGSLTNATVGSKNVLKGLMHAGVHTTTTDDPELVIIGHSTETLTLRAAQNFTLRTDDTGALPYQRGDIVPWNASHSRLSFEGCDNPFAPLVHAESTVQGIVRVSPITHIPLSKLTPNSALSNVDIVSSYHGQYADVATTGTPRVFTRVATDTFYAPSHQLAPDGTLISVLNSAPDAPNTVLHQGDVQISSVTFVLDSDLTVRSVWGAHDDNFGIVPSGGRRIWDADLLSRAVRFDGQDRPLRYTVPSGIFYIREEKDSNNLAFTSAFHGEVTYVYVSNTDPDQELTVTSTPLHTPHVESAAFRYTLIDGVQEYSSVDMAAGTTALIESIDELYVSTVRWPEPGIPATIALTKITNAAQQVRSAAMGTSAYDDVYSMSVEPIVSNADVTPLFDALSANNELLVWSARQQFLRANYDAPVGFLALSDDASKYAIFSVLGYDAAREPNGAAQVACASVSNDASTLFTVTCTSAVPALVAVRPASDGLSLTDAFTPAMEFRPALTPDDIAQLNAALKTYDENATNISAVIVLPPQHSAVFGLQGTLRVQDIAAASTGALRGQLVVSGPEPFPDVRVQRLYFNTQTPPSADDAVWVSSTRTVVLLDAGHPLRNAFYMDDTATLTLQSGTLRDARDSGTSRGVLMNERAVEGATLFTDAATDATDAVGSSWILMPHTGANAMQRPEEMQVLSSFAGDAQMKVVCPTPCVVSWTPLAPNTPFSYAHPGVVSGNAVPVTVQDDNAFVFKVGTCILDSYFISTLDALGEPVPIMTSLVPFYTTASKAETSVSLQQCMQPTASYPLGLIPVAPNGLLHDWWDAGMAHAVVQDAPGSAAANDSGATRFVPVFYRAGGVHGHANGNVVRAGAVEYVYVQAFDDAASAAPSSSWSAEYTLASLQAAAEHMRVFPSGNLVVLDTRCTALNAEPVYTQDGVAAVYRTVDIPDAHLKVAPVQLPVSLLDALYPVRGLQSVNDATTLSDVLSTAPHPPLTSTVVSRGKPFTCARMSMGTAGQDGASGVFDTAAPGLLTTMPAMTALGLSSQTSMTAFIAAPRTFDENLNLLPAEPQPGGSVIVRSDASVSALANTHTLTSNSSGGVTEQWILSGHADGTWAAIPFAHAVSTLTCAPVNGGTLSATGVRAGSVARIPLTPRDVSAGAALAQAIGTAASLAYTVRDGAVYFQGVDATELQSLVPQTRYARLRNAVTENIAVFTRETARTPLIADVFQFDTAVPDNFTLQDNPDSADGPRIDAIELSALCAAIVPVRVLDVQGGWGAVLEQVTSPGMGDGGDQIPPTEPDDTIGMIDINESTVSEADVTQALAELFPRGDVVETMPQLRRINVPDVRIDSRWVVLRRLLRRRPIGSITRPAAMAAFLRANVSRASLILRVVVTVYYAYRVRPPNAILQLMQRNTTQRVVLFNTDVESLL